MLKRHKKFRRLISAFAVVFTFIAVSFAACVKHAGNVLASGLPAPASSTVFFAKAYDGDIHFVDESGSLAYLMKKYGVSLKKAVMKKINIKKPAAAFAVKNTKQNNNSIYKEKSGKNAYGNLPKKILSIESSGNKLLSRKIMNSKKRDYGNKHNKIHIPAQLRQKVSLEGKGTVKQALMLLSRETDIPIVFYSGFPKKLKNESYYKNISLYKVLGGLTTSNGFKYQYNNGIINIYAVEEKTFHIPVSDLLSSFSSTVGTVGGEGSNFQAGNYNATGSQSQPGAGNLQSVSGNSTAQGSTGSLSLTLSESGSIYSIISENIKKMLTPEGKYFINPKDGLLWVKDRISNVNEISAYMRSIEKFLSKQVLLKVEVIDIALNSQYQAGIDWNLLFNQAFKSNAAGISAISLSANLASGNNISQVPYISFNGSNGGESAVLNALKTQGTVNVISQPRLLLMDGQTRLISSGTITPYVSSVQTMSLSISQTATYPVISQVQTGLSISFTPHINFKDKSVSVTVSLIDNSITGYQSFSASGYSFSNPVIESKNFSDTVSVKSGMTVLIGGLLTSGNTKNNYGIPILSRLPLIGRIFKSINESGSKEDLLIMLTPEITPS